MKGISEMLQAVLQALGRAAGLMPSSKARDAQLTRRPSWAESSSFKDIHESVKKVSPDKSLAIATKHLPLGSVFRCSNTIAAALSFTIFQLFYTSVGVLGLYGLAKEKVWYGMSGRALSSSKFSFTILETRSAQIRHWSDLPAWGVSKEGHLLSHNHSQAVKLREDGAVTLELSLEDPIDFDGWFFNTSASRPPEYDPVKFKFHYWTGDRWQAAGSSSDIDYAGSVIYLDGYFPTSSARGSCHTFSIYKPIPVRTVDFLSRLTSYSLIATAGFLAVFKRNFLAQHISLLVHPSMVVLFSFEALSTSPLDVSWSTLRAFVLVVLHSIHSIIMLQNEMSNNFIWRGCYLLLFGLCTAGRDFFGPKDCSSECIRSGSIFFFLGTLFKILGWHSKLSAINSVKEDARKYNLMWEELMLRPSTLMLVRKLEHTCEMLESVAQVNRVADLPRSAVVSALFQHIQRRCRQRDAHGQLVRELETLYMQAQQLQVVLRSKVLQWAAISDGYLRAVKGQGGGGGLVSVREDLDKKSIGWAKLKRVDRAVEKIMRCYGGDVSMIVDICRQDIVFDDVQQIITCLRAITNDRDVHMLGVKNSLSTKFDSSRSAGYRHVALYFNISNKETIASRCSRHVCELQLVLSKFYNLKSSEGHRRYICFRNLMGE
ncbi:hypothetical protein GUITHDRAFT_122923 [Guillardia theta CCMP2712]|uniref:Uncharacterized protein n=2 Tax=Guillardia theta TaxID=55529 RepID=L1I4R5_GUITC|nr:hypothetical protein GUITHDRAFT_122923 [Guillardia theta CCMP2712]EKX30869.1 hypothetical protein GUITHDRAFT_122923 [Guillardia theta CCMP2712]|eukprot:XP_005817849.1 hypothetical protein GUITHDRAFT_122923 [Guillardia theta CCMP2712]